MYNLEFRFGIHETRRLNIPDDVLSFSFNDVACNLISLDNKTLKESLSFSVNCNNVSTIEGVNLLKEHIFSWLLKFGYKTHTLITFPEDNIKVTKDGVIEVKIRLRSDIDYYVMLEDDKQLLLDSIGEINNTNLLFYEMFNNAIDIKSDELKLIYLMSILETIVAKHPKIPRVENERFIKSIKKLQSYTKEFNVDENTLGLLNTKLDNCKEISIRNKLKYLSNMLKIKEIYCDLKPTEFIQKCYSIRSDFAHSGIIKIPKELEKYDLVNINGNLRQVVWHCIKLVLN